MKERQLATVSRMRAYRTCPRYHDYTYNRFVEPVYDEEADAMRFGTAGHAALEAWLNAIQFEEGSAAVVATDAAIDAADRGGLDAFERERLIAVIDGYHLRWADAPYEVLAVETQFRTRLLNPATGAPSKLFDEAGKIDGIVRDLRDGRVWVLEHKFTSADVSPGSTYWQRLRIDSQISVYIDGAAALGFPDVAGCLYDVISKPSIKPYKATPEADREFTQGKGCKWCGGRARGVQGTGRTALRDHVYQTNPQGHVTCVRCEVRAADAAQNRCEGPCPVCNGSGWEDAPRLYANQRAVDETPEEFGDRVRAALAEAPERFYARGAVVRFDAELVEARRDVWQTVLQIRESQRSGHHPRNPDACAYLYGRVCPFLPVCAGEAQLDDPRYRMRSSAHPELETPDAPKEGAEGLNHGSDTSSDSDHRAA